MVPSVENHGRHALTSALRGDSDAAMPGDGCRFKWEGATNRGMFAIAGAKGGCGKTTVTIGLADAFSRAGTPAVAVDADRQLPNLHVVAGADRTPTLVDVASDGELEAVVQGRQGPDGDGVGAGVGIVPAPEPSERAEVDFELAIDRLERTGAEVLVDCPSGAGPDAVEPLEYADAAVVVTTATDRGLDAAATTVEIARRLDTPIAGAIVTLTDGVTDTLESSLGIPVLGTVPDCESPLTEAAARTAFDDLAAAVARRATATPSPGSDREGSAKSLLSTGNRAVDRTLGGVPPGTVVAVTAHPASQSERLLYEATATRGTLYLTTDRSRNDVERAIQSTTVRTGNPTVRRLDRDEPVEHARRLIGELPEGANLVIDSVAPLERTAGEAYPDVLNAVADRMAETGGIAILHCLRGAEPNRRTTTLHLADAVFDVRTISAGVGTGVEHRIAVPKFRSDGRRSPIVELDRHEKGERDDLDSEGDPTAFEFAAKRDDRQGKAE
ncbi:MinD-like ATPase involved in chromosome partitioning or flagellar assembly [Halobiforma haloterrestris]|uniref:MinD-like ATPase involved in chromosome partitioning or flagellar assembly n=2 Tax=Natronobacterium haloterrestre TaxID=148448 RepID=A0A1I1KW13_NATHA|nr:MinD-like ATPase involved in chromosome partitioning or flagellar assembly [Halobiforma haloterrestris]